MTVKDKAQHLINKFSPLVTTWDCYWDCPANPDDILMDAKKCALIAVDEILVAIRNSQTEYPEEQEMNENYWQQVKTEIEKL